MNKFEEATPIAVCNTNDPDYVSGIFDDDILSSDEQKNSVTEIMSGVSKEDEAAVKSLVETLIQYRDNRQQQQSRSVKKFQAPLLHCAPSGAIPTLVLRVKPPGVKAMILVGGYGTRLRPLTLSVPKPLIQFCNKSILEHQIAALVKAGVNHVILAVAYQPQAMMEALNQLELKFNIRISCSREDEPLGTAGPLRLAKDLLTADDSPDQPFFLCNSDVICEFPLSEMLAFHRQHQAEGTILVTTLEDPSKFGVVVSDDRGKIEKFVEKPKEFVGDQINAGLYILNKSVIDRIQLRPTSIEHDIFPLMAADKTLYRFKLNGYWADIGQPQDFLRGMELFLSRLAEKSPMTDDADLTLAAEGDTVTGNVLIHPTVKIGKGGLIGPNVTIGSNCVIEDGVRILNSAVMEGVKIRSHSYINGSIVGWHSRIGCWARLEGLTVVGENVSVANERFINKSFILPHKSIDVSILQPGQVIM